MSGTSLLLRSVVAASNGRKACSYKSAKVVSCPRLAPVFASAAHDGPWIAISFCVYLGPGPGGGFSWMHGKTGVYGNCGGQYDNGFEDHTGFFSPG